MIETSFTRRKIRKELGIGKNDKIEYYLDYKNFFSKELLLIEKLERRLSGFSIDVRFDTPIKYLKNSSSRPRVEEYYSKNYYQLFIKTYIKEKRKFNNYEAL